MSQLNKPIFKTDKQSYLKHKAEYQFININDKVIRNTIQY